MLNACCLLPTPIIGPSILAHRPSDVFTGILALLPESVFYNTDHLLCSQEDSGHVCVHFCNHDTASRLCAYWSQVNPLAGTPHIMTICVADARVDVLAALFGQGN